MSQRAPDTPTAVIVRACCTTGVGFGADAGTGRPAAVGAPRLECFLAGPAATARPVAPPALFCDSYGSVVCGLPDLPAAEVTDLVVLASPGMRTDSAADFGTGVRTGATARNHSHWIGRIPNLRIGDLGHVADPADRDVGARVVSSERSRGHDGCFAPGTGSLHNFADTALGRHRAVSCADTDRDCRHELV
ncbi:alpha/beta hydrolase [Streptomyces hawaiiensis]|uniref:alpha/beta hydrolase n=1 Tax=Streptomyces hawaiiensis TaxID=67305 RepID=UPI0036498A92